MKFQGWERILSEYIENQARVPFEWGVSDCLLFVSDAALLITGKDPAEPARGAYNNEIEAARLIIELRGTTENIMDCHFNRIYHRAAQRGDIVLKYRENGAAFGLVSDGMAVFKTENKGLVFESLTTVDIAWRVE